MDDGVWETAERLAAWLDGASTRPREVKLLLQVLKITEEAGEAAEALQGVLGANPRKGHSHTEEDVAAELCDVILTAMVALSTLTPDAQAVFRRHLDRVADRSLTGGRAPQHTPREDVVSGPRPEPPAASEVLFRTPNDEKP